MKNQEPGRLPFLQQGVGAAAIGRRGMLSQCGMGFGAVALAELLRTEQLRGAEREPLNPMQPRPAQLPSRVKHVIHLFMNGGPSHVDTFDPKPELQRRGGELLSGGNLKTERPTGALFPSPWRFRRHGQSGIEVSELFPHTAQHVDDMCIIRSMHADVPNHEPSLWLMNCGEGRMPRPAMGSWVTYGLGSEAADLPGFVVLTSLGRGGQNQPIAARQWSSG
ncbi:MAG: DUF1501 domain-containing protein, partial [Planctomycetota bacterium]